MGTSVRRQVDEDGSREEILCANCDGHLGQLPSEPKSMLIRFVSTGHVFRGEGIRDGNGKVVQERHCVNSASLKFAKKA